MCRYNVQIGNVLTRNKVLFVFVLFYFLFFLSFYPVPKKKAQWPTNRTRAAEICLYLEQLKAEWTAAECPNKHTKKDLL